MKKILIAISITILLVSACDRGSGARAGNNPPAGNNAAASAENIAPVFYSAFGNGYTFTSYEIITDEDDGNTVIIFYGTGYGVISYENDVWGIPAKCEAVSGSATHEAAMVGTMDDRLNFIFDSYIEPETITIINGDTLDIILTVDVNSGQTGQGA